MAGWLRQGPPAWSNRRSRAADREPWPEFRMSRSWTCRGVERGEPRYNSRLASHLGLQIGGFPRGFLLRQWAIHQWAIHHGYVGIDKKLSSRSRVLWTCVKSCKLWSILRHLNVRRTEKSTKLVFSTIQGCHSSRQEPGPLKKECFWCYKLISKEFKLLICSMSSGTIVLT